MQPRSPAWFSACRFLAAPVPAIAGLFPAGRPNPAGTRADLLAEGESLFSRKDRALGWLLYFDKRLSVDGTVSCAWLPRPETRLFTDGAAFSKGIRGQLGRAAPTVINRAYSLEQFWDGRAKTLEEQAKGPIENPVEMGHAHDLCEKCRLRHRRLSLAIQGGLR